MKTMYHLDDTNTNSLSGALVTMLLTLMAHITKDDVLIYVSIIAGLITIGYTIDKWIRSYRRKK